MRKNVILTPVLLIAAVMIGNTQPANYDVLAGNGNGLRFWQSDEYKIHMGNTAEYKYGEVTDYSIKMNMNNNSARGWTWGVMGTTPVASISTLGHMKLAGILYAGANILNLQPSSGWLGLTADLPGYPVGIYPTLKTNGTHVYFSAAGKYSAYLGEADTKFGLNNTNSQTKILLSTNGVSWLNGGNVAIGHESPYAPSRLHVKSPSDTPWGFVVEAGSSSKIVGIGHDGTNGYVSTSYLGSSGYSPLHLRTSNLTRLAISTEGLVGIGTPIPNTKLEVVGTGGSTVDLKVNGRIQTGDASNAGGVWINSPASMLFIGQQGPSSVGFYNNGAWRLIADVNGNVGIGTTSPNHKLTVNGIIYGKEVKVNLSVPGPDYVFENTYDLPSLQEVSAYINANKHLPEVPSAKEMEANGINVGEMNMILLKKIEELTLYLIDLKKDNELSKTKIEKMEAEIISLKIQK
jgi:hypothetical protein